MRAAWRPGPGQLGAARNERLDLEIRADVVVGAEREHAPAAEALDLGDERLNAYRIVEIRHLAS